jgi:hypothetical protein
MSTVALVLSLVTITTNAAIAVADLARARFVLANSAAVGVPPSWLPGLGLTKAAGAAGLLLGLLGVPVLGLLAGIGLVLFYIGAVIAHVRAGALRTIGAPAGMLALAVATVLST